MVKTVLFYKVRALKKDLLFFSILLTSSFIFAKSNQVSFNFENIKLKFTDAAIRAIAEKATERKTGARGLRAVLEETMLEIMFDLPSQPEVEEVIINDEVVLNGEKPMLVYENKKQAS